MDPAGKVAIVTGATSGIGMATAHALCAAGATVVGTGRNAVALKQLESDLDGFVPVVHDVRGEPAEVLDAAARVGDLAILVNNAGIQHAIDFRAAAAIQDIGSEIEVNLCAPIRMTAAALPVLLDRPEAAIVNVTSVLAVTPKRSAPVYCASKAGLRSFTTALRYQLSGTSVRVIEVMPPLVDTAMTSGRPGDKVAPEVVADALVDAVRQGREHAPVGQAESFLRLFRVAPAKAARTVRDS